MLISSTSSGFDHGVGMMSPPAAICASSKDIWKAPPFTAGNSYLVISKLALIAVMASSVDWHPAARRFSIFRQA